MKTLILILLFSSSLLAQTGPWHIRFATGFELSGSSGATTGSNSPDGFETNFQSGVASYGGGRAGGGANFTTHSAISPSQYHPVLFKTFSPSLSGAIRGGFWYNFASTAPVTASRIFWIDNTHNGGSDQAVEIWRLASNKVAIGVNGSLKDSTSSAVPLNSWEYVSFYTTWLSSGNTNRIVINGQTLNDYTSLSSAATRPTFAILGYFDFAANSSGSASNFSADDLVFYDSSGTTGLSSVVDSMSVLYSPAVSDTAIGGWTAGAGSTSNLWDALDNTPQTGNSTESNTTNIKNSVSSTTDNYDAAVKSYTVIGVPAGKDIIAVFGAVRTGEHGATGTESAGLSLQGNPTDGGEVTFNFGNDLGAHGNDNTTSNLLWVTSFSDPVYLPTVTRTSRPIVRIGRRTANTNQVCVDALGEMILYGTAPATNPTTFMVIH